MTDDVACIGYLRRVGFASLAVGVAGGSACAFGHSAESASFHAAYLTAFMYWLNLTLGCLALAMLHGITGGGWGTSVRRVLEAGYQTLPVMALAFLPIWLDVEHIYEWTDSAVMQHSETLLRKLKYLNVEAWSMRAVVLFGLWFVAAALLDRVSPTADPDRDSRRERRLQAFGGVGLIVYVFSVTVASVDWVMSLEPHWFSTMYGVLYMAAQAVAGLALAILCVVKLESAGGTARPTSPTRWNDLGNLLFAFGMFWAYVQLMQFLIIWSGNLPEENVWYLRRMEGGWLYVAWLVIAFHCVWPFLLLLSRQRKRNPTRLARVALLLLVMEYVGTAWMTMPGVRHGRSGVQGIALMWLAPAAFAAIGGVWGAWFAWRWAMRSRVPIYDPEPTSEPVPVHRATAEVRP